MLPVSPVAPVSNIVGSHINGSPLVAGNSTSASIAPTASLGNIPTAVVPMPFSSSQADNDTRYKYRKDRKGEDKNSRIIYDGKGEHSGLSSAFLAQSMSGDDGFYGSDSAISGYDILYKRSYNSFDKAGNNLDSESVVRALIRETYKKASSAYNNAISIMSEKKTA